MWRIPSGQWQGYLDTDTNRAWGVAEWGSRAGQAAYFDWVVGNALLPPVSTNVGIQQIDRTTVSALGDIATGYTQIQSEVDKGDQGLSPLGLVKNVIPFDIEPTQGSGSHFERITGRAVVAVNNALALFNLASGARQALLAQADSLTAFNDNVQNQEAEFNNQLIQSFGHPYSDDIGAGAPTPPGTSARTCTTTCPMTPAKSSEWRLPNSVTFFATNEDIEVAGNGALYTNLVPVSYNFATNDYYGMPIPASWTGVRQAPGSIQLAQSSLLQARAAFDSSVVSYENLIEQIQDEAGLLQSQFNVNAQIVTILNSESNTVETLDQAINDDEADQLGYQLGSQAATQVADAAVSVLPTVAGFEAGLSDGVTLDPSFLLRGVIMAGGDALSDTLAASANTSAEAQLGAQQAQQLAQDTASIQVTVLNQNQAVSNQVAQLQDWCVRRPRRGCSSTNSKKPCNSPKAVTWRQSPRDSKFCPTGCGSGSKRPPRCRSTATRTWPTGPFKTTRCKNTKRPSTLRRPMCTWPRQPTTMKPPWDLMTPMGRVRAL